MSYMWKKIIFGIVPHVVVEMEKIQYYKIFKIQNKFKILWNNEETKTSPTNFNEWKAIHKAQNLYILIVFLLITIALLITVSIYCYLIKYRAKQKHLPLFSDTNNKLKQVLYW